MYDALRTLNRVQAEPIIEAHATGVAIAATYYLEAFPTEVIDVFILAVVGIGYRIASDAPADLRSAESTRRRRLPLWVGPVPANRCLSHRIPFAARPGLRNDR